MYTFDGDHCYKSRRDVTIIHTALRAMTEPLNEYRYRALLAEVGPRVIDTQEEYDRLLAVSKRLQYTEGRTVEEAALYRLLVKLIDLYERDGYPIDSKPYEILQQLMESMGVLQIDLVPVLGTRGQVSVIVNGKVGISRKNAKALAEYFGVSPRLFLRGTGYEVQEET